MAVHSAGAGQPRGAGPEPARIWWTPRAVGMHATLVVALPVFGALFWWQVQRVREGNTLSWAYVFEWPFFAGYAIYIWWKLVHDQAEPVARPAWDPRTDGVSPLTDAGSARVDGVPPGAEVDDARRPDASAVDEELAAYNRYLAELHASGRPKRW